ncbi:GGDEF domain-containing protein [Alteromonas sp. ASW11-36]|uniref:diguanylate cyclase n=1 Tax=Alteromonas arenosi TaxID=3055817 RepID=A0ABT7SW67_9ALTE|nr:GGDEF domain-containing protein [Alteromonas sp. ASW11-36]MDM7860269.1 GGDEF domain-containing protein [Alteromonas sp. ASW11-36]
MDIFTLTVCTALLSAGMAVTFTTQLITSRRETYLYDWIFAAGCFLSSNIIGLWLLKDSSDSINPMFANAFYVTAHAAIFSGTSRLLFGQSMYKVVALAFVATLILHQLPIVATSVESRIIVHYLIIIAFNAATLMALIAKRKSKREGKAYWLLIFALALFIVQLLIRGTMMVSKDFELMLVGSHFTQTSGTLLLMLYVFALTVGGSAIVMWRKELSLRELALTDELTGWLNRKSLEQVANNELRKSERKGTHLAILVIDIDHFKQVNDCYGHAVGDKAIQFVSGIIKQQSRDYDHHFRLGGEEFVVLAAETSPSEAKTVAERIRIAVESTTMRHNSESIPLTVSVGVALSQHGELDWQGLLNRADMALYASKYDGRNRVSVDKMEHVAI